MVDEVRQIEGKVIEISKLQELFSQNVLVQVSNSDIPILVATLGPLSTDV